MSSATETPPARRVSPGWVALIWAGLSAVLVLTSLSRIVEHTFLDPDDVLRLVQVRDLLAGQGWFDLHQYRVDGPAGMLMHWSRIVDAPLALVIWLLSPIIGQPAAEQVACIAIPLLTMGAIVFTVAAIASRYLDRAGVILSCLCIGLSPLVLAQVQPMRIDHHGWQIFLVVLALAGLAQGRAAKAGPVLTAAALATGLSISLELLPIAAAFGLVFAVRWLLDGKTSRPLVTFLAALAGGLVFWFLATRGLADLAQHCDAVSPVYLLLFGLLAVGTWGVALSGVRSRVMLLAMLGGVGVVALAACLWLAPQCAAGPFGNLDPLVREFWYEHVAEGRPAWRISLVLWAPLALHGLIGAAVLAHLGKSTSGEERQWWFEYLLVLVIALGAGLLTWRSMAFVGALVAIPLGWLAARLFRAVGETTDIGRKAVIALAMLLALVPSVPFVLGKAIVSSITGNAGPDDQEPEVVCDMVNSAPRLNRLAPAVFFAPIDISPQIVLGSHHSVVATGHHRDQKAIGDVIAAFIGTSARAHELVLKHRASYVVICDSLTEVGLYKDKAPKGFAAQLIRGQVPAWLEPVRLDVPRELKIWRVVDAPPQPKP